MRKLWYWHNPDECGYYITESNHTPRDAEFAGEISDQQAHLLLALVPNCVSEDK
jgi:hypothetical protein